MLDIKVNNMPMVALVNPVYDCLMRLAKPDALLNEEEVSHWFFFFGFFFVGHHLLFLFYIHVINVT